MLILRLKRFSKDDFINTDNFDFLILKILFLSFNFIIDSSVKSTHFLTAEAVKTVKVKIFIV